MTAGKLVLLLVAGGIAGVAFAGMTTGVMRPYREQDEAADLRVHGVRADDEATAYAAPIPRESWLDEGISALDFPAWPFGPRAEEDSAPAYTPDGYEGYPPPGYERRDLYADGRYYQEPDEAPIAAQLPAYPEDRRAALPLAQPLAAPPAARRTGDAAADAAARAAIAAQDVLAAEEAH